MLGKSDSNKSILLGIPSLSWRKKWLFLFNAKTMTGNPPFSSLVWIFHFDISVRCSTVCCQNYQNIQGRCLNPVLQRSNLAGFSVQVENSFFQSKQDCFPPSKWKNLAELWPTRTGFQRPCYTWWWCVAAANTHDLTVLTLGNRNDSCSYVFNEVLSSFTFFKHYSVLSNIHNLFAI